MTPTLRAEIAVALLAIGCGGGAGTTSSAVSAQCPGAVDPEGAWGVLEDQAAAWNRGDVDGFMGGYERSDAVVFTSGGQVRTGFAEARERYRARYGDDAASMGHLAFERLDLRVLGACGDVVVVLGRFHLTGGAHPGSGVFSVVLAHGPEGWNVVHDHTSAAPTPPVSSTKPSAEAPAAPPPDELLRSNHGDTDLVLVVEVTRTAVVRSLRSDDGRPGYEEVEVDATVAEVLRGIGPKAGDGIDYRFVAEAPWSPDPAFTPGRRWLVYLRATPQGGLFVPDVGYQFPATEETVRRAREAAESTRVPRDATDGP